LTGRLAIRTTKAVMRAV